MSRLSPLHASSVDVVRGLDGPATAVWLQVPLVAHDRIFANVKDLELVTKLAD
jgi:hypothetical protein